MNIPSAIAASLLLFSFGGATQPAPSEFCVTVLPGAPATTATAHALTWEKQTQEVEATLGQKIVRSTYRFTNTGTSPVALVGLVPSCGCVSTQIDKLIFAPGETGELKVTLDLAMDDAVGQQERFIIVTTDDAPKAPATLRLSVHVPSAIESSAKTVTWKIGELPMTKEIVVGPGPGIKDMKLRSGFQSTDFAMAIKPDPNGRTYHVSITPTNTASLCYAQIQLEAESSSFRFPITCNINANVN